MFDIDSSELILIAVVALVVIGPKDLPRVMRMVGQWVGRARGMARHVRSGFDTMMREAELDELNKRWETENKAIMAATAHDPAAWQLSPSLDAATMHGLSADPSAPVASVHADGGHPGYEATNHVHVDQVHVDQVHADPVHVDPSHP